MFGLFRMGEARGRTRIPRRLRLESLENRTLLAGDVAVALDGGGNLNITGDVEDNSIVITDSFVPGQVAVWGVATRTNGTLFPSFVNGVTGDIVANMHGGNDRVVVTGMDLPGSLMVNAQQATDTVVVANTNLIAGSLDIDTADGVGRVVITNVLVGDATNLGGGTDEDAFVVVDSTFHGDVTVSLSDGKNSFKSIGTDYLGSLSTTGGNSNDYLLLVGSRGQHAIVTGTSDLNTGDSNDTVIVVGMTFLSSSTVKLGDGNDRLMVVESTYSTGGLFDGEGDSDLIVSVSNTGLLPAFNNFESIAAV